MKIRRFTPIQKTFHLLLIATFLTQAVTGMARMYSTTFFGRGLASLVGGMENCLAVHKAVGLAMIVLFACHVVYALFLIFAKKINSHDSMVPNLRDAKDFFAHLRWMVGGKHPRFGRWGYWEKFDYWAVFWGMVLLGRTGLMLYDPVETSRYLDGSDLNVALWAHRLEAILAMGYIFIVHFGVVILRRDSFPMDQAMWGGHVDLETVKAERPDWVERLEQTGELKDRLVESPSKPLTALSYLLGLTAVALGMYLLIGGLMNAPLLPW
ncbi:MAG: cytochrome b/b6 domain-containing protein [Proteobacteria bacterium]|nr:cytochrome b/b6 domain-containing protein [Pseudomonadota bacterium]